MDSDEICSRMLRAYKSAVQSSVKFGVKEFQKERNKQCYLIKRKINNFGSKQLIRNSSEINDYKTFRVLQDDEPTPRGYQRIPYHIVFDVKFDGRRKARLVAGGNRTDPPKEDIFSGVVSMEAVRLGFILARMNDLQVCAGDVGNAFLNGKTNEKVFIVAGPEFGPKLHGKRLIVDRSLYGLRSSAARFHEHLSVKLR